MIRYSIIIPHRDTPDVLGRQLMKLQPVLDRLELPSEVVCVDDGSTGDALSRVERLMATCSRTRLLRFDQPRGISGALSAGISAATGDIFVATQAGLRYPAVQIPHLIAGLSRADIVFGRRRRGRAAKWGHRLARSVRGSLLGLEVRDPGILFWAARREAVAGLELDRGMYRYLSTYVAARGFRVGECPIDVNREHRAARDGWPNPGDLLAAWWHRRRYRGGAAREIIVRASAPSITAFPDYQPPRTASTSKAA